MSRLRINQLNSDRPFSVENIWMFKVGDILGDPECPLMCRWVIQSPWLSVRIHHFYRSDNDRMLHDHPWWFITMPLSRHGYLNETYCAACGGKGRGDDCKLDSISGCCVLCGGSGRMFDRVRWLRPAYRPAGHIHAVKLDKGPCWTFIVTGRKAHNWGFWSYLNGKFYQSREFFGKFGHPACED